jgi:hypothetical protein
MDEAVDHGRGDDGITEDPASAAEGLVGGSVGPKVPIYS